jgi:hypothetical protein
MSKDAETEGYLIRAKRVAEELVLLAGYLPGSQERTHIKGHAEDALAYIQKLLDEME